MTDETSRDVEEKRSGRRRGALVAVLVAMIAAAVVALWPHDGGDEVAAPRAATTARADGAKPASPRVAATKPARRAESPVTPEASAPEAPSAKPAVPKPAGDGTAVVVEVVDEDGRAVGGAAVDLKAVHLERLVGQSRAFDILRPIEDRAVPPDGRLVVDRITSDMDGIDVEGLARAPGFAPSAAVAVTVLAKQVVTLRLVVVRRRSIDVLVLDAETQAPIAGASVCLRDDYRSERRATDAAGRCVFANLVPGAHEIGVTAAGHLRSDVTCDEGPLVVRLRRIGDVGTLIVTVIGKDGRPMADVAVELDGDDDVVVRTDKSGRAAFESVPVGRPFVSIGLSAGIARLGPDGWTRTASVEVKAGERCEATLGYLRGTASLHGRVVREDGTPVGGVGVRLGGDAWFEATTDRAGDVRLTELPSGRFLPSVTCRDGSGWSFDSIEVAEGAHVEAVWTLGGVEIRGRVVQGDAGTPVEGFLVFADGPIRGSTMTRPDGRFVLSGARPGAYRLSSFAFGTHERIAPVSVSIPSDSEIVLRIVECGRVKVRFGDGERASSAEALVILLDADGGPVPAWGDSAGDGERIFRDVVPGKFEVEVWRDGRSLRFPVEVLPGKTAVVDVRLP